MTILQKKVCLSNPQNCDMITQSWTRLIRFLDENGVEHFGEPLLDPMILDTSKIREAFKIHGDIYGECKKAERLKVAKVCIGLTVLTLIRFWPHSQEPSRF
jgi:hypothetical protein